MVTTSVRIPIKIKEEADKLVEEGYFKNMSELVVNGIRNEIKEYSPSKAVRDIREFRDKTWQDFIKKAGGDKGKAADMCFDEIKKFEENSELVKWAKANGRYLKYNPD